MLNKIQHTLYYFVTSLFLLFSPTLLANEGTTDIFNPDAVREGTDKSIYLLGMIFGNVDGVLQSQGSQILGVMFGIFNAAILGLGGIIVLYTLVVSTLNTAQEGEYLGKKWSSLWIPIRSAMGIALLVPKASGYSVIQIFVMWVVLQGVAAADTMWGTALEYIKQGGTFTPQSMGHEQVKRVAQTAEEVLRLQICNAALEYHYNQQHQPERPVKFRTLFREGSGSKPHSFSFVDEKYIPDSDTGLVPAMCGTVTFDARENSVEDAAVIAGVQAMVGYTENVARQYVKEKLDTVTVPSRKNGQEKKIKQLQEMAVNDLTAATLDFITPLVPVVRSANERQSREVSETLELSKNDGWITAGGYYQVITGVSNKNDNRGDVASYLPKVEIPEDYTSHENKGVEKWRWRNIDGLIDRGSKDFFWVQYSKQASKQANRDAGPMGIAVSANIASDSNASAFQLPFNAAHLRHNFVKHGEDYGAKVIVSMLTFGMVDTVSGFFSKRIATENASEDPILAVAKLGSDLINFSAGLWITLGILLTAIAALVAWGSCMNPGGFALLTFVSWIVPFMTVIITFTFAGGAILAYYVPFIPFILFLFGALGWFLGVIESIIAAPLVALGVAHPEGHEAYGRAEPAVMLIVNIFLRPSLMIVGLIAAILLSYVGLKLMNLIFAPFVLSMFDRGLDTSREVVELGLGINNALEYSSFAEALKGFAIILIYVLLVVQIVSKVFTLINEVPMRVMRWLGSQDQLGDSSVNLQEIRGAISGVTSQTGQSMGSGIQTQSSNASAHMSRNWASMKNDGGKTTTVEAGDEKKGGS
jgi:defect-in-organelle-trafficking protein DotA